MKKKQQISKFQITNQFHCQTIDIHSILKIVDIYHWKEYEHYVFHIYDSPNSMLLILHDDYIRLKQQQQHEQINSISTKKLILHSIEILSVKLV